MEDVVLRALRALRSVFSILLVLAITINTVGAATQGSLGRSGSQGSISISLVIPDNTQLVLQDINVLDQSHFCLKVLDSIRQSSVNHYRIAGLRGDLLANYGAGETDYLRSSEQVELENGYYENNTGNEGCHYEMSIANTHSTNNKSALLFMLIVE